MVAASSVVEQDDEAAMVVETKIGSLSLIAPEHLRKFVVHCRRAKFDVYCGRRNPLFADSDFAWGNPIKMDKESDRERVCRAFALWATDQPDYVERARTQLRGKVLACWCAPKMCHCDILVQIANSDN